MLHNKPCIFSGLSILVGQQWVDDQALVVENGKITAIIPKEMQKHHLPAERYEFPSNYYLVPGFIDLHIHGANGFDVMDGTTESLVAISQALIKEGVTSFLATTMTTNTDHLTQVLSTIAETISNIEMQSAMLGVHLEGPFIAKSKSGAQFSDHVESPNIKLLAQLQSAAKNNIKIMTFAPELKDAYELIETAKNLNIIPSIGHTNATYDETMKAIESGCSRATHLFNAMRGIHQREPGTVGALLTANVMAELIVDNIHLHPAIVKLTYLLKGKDRINLVTDAIRAKCLGNGNYDLGGQNVSVMDDIATLADGTLAGSTLRMPDAIKNMITASGCSFSDAVLMASLIPARILSIDNQKGDIAVGKDADLVVLNEVREVVLTMRGGKVLHRCDDGDK